VTPFEPDMASQFVEADLAVSQGGYNTVAELEQIGVKTVLVPAEREWDDQFARAEKAMREHKTFRVFRGKASSELAELAADFLREPHLRGVAAKSSGGMKAAEAIYRIVR
jgi:predicted glycosyltransferase